MPERIKRLARERQTLQAMIQIYCRGKHGTQGALCEDCLGLEDYALGRLKRCPFADDKPTCAACTVHCYKPEMRERIKHVMRYAGPRMLTRHPKMAIQHMADGIGRKRKTDAG